MADIQRQLAEGARALFDLEAATPAPAPKLTTGQRRIQRQAEALQHGQHPLAVALHIPIRLHADAPTDRLDQTAPGLRCGTCRYRDLHNGGTGSHFPKCWLPGPQPGVHPRISRGPGTDVRAWWPACPAHEAKEANGA